MSVINTNITSMIGQSNLNKSQNALQTSMERLSSGMRINSAKDDAAGQAIANRMTAQITGLNQAARNANDGISVAQTAEGALNQINDNLQRVRELSVQAANGTNSENDLQSIQDEINQRLDEINRISEETDFNGVKVLSEETGDLRIQVGANDSEVINVRLETINAASLNLTDFNVNNQVRNERVTDASALTAAGFELDTDTDAYTGFERMAATDAQIDSLVAAGDLIDLGDGQFASDPANAEADVAAFVAQAADGNTIEVGDTTYTFSDAGDGSWSAATANTFDGGDAAVNSTAAADSLLGELDFSGGRIEINVDGQADAWLAEDGEIFDAATDGSQLAGDAATLAGVIESDNFDSTTIDGVEYSVGVAAGAVTLTATETVTAADVEAAITNSSDAITATLGGAEYTVTSSNTIVTGDDAVSGDAVFVDSDGLLTEENGGAASDATAFFVQDGSVFAGNIDDAGVVTPDTDSRIYVDADASGLAQLTTDPGEEISYFAIEDDEGNITGFNTRADGTGDFAYLDATDEYTADQFRTEAGAATAEAMSRLDEALNKVDSLRSELGAVQNRFEDAINNLNTNATNLSAARSRIEDADYAEEVANMTRAQILQQAGTSVLAQANQIPQNVLSLLG